MSKAQEDELRSSLTADGIAHIVQTAKPVLSRYAKAPTHLRTNPLLVRMGVSLGAASTVERIENVTRLFERYDETLKLQRIYVAPEGRDDCIERLTTLAAGA